MEVGCGWGLAGIYCAKMLNAQVTCLDMDSEVFPYLQLQAEVNNVNIATQTMKMEDISSNQLSGVDVLIGADICFWDEMASSLIKLIQCAQGAGVRLVMIADPGRIPFATLENHYIKLNHQHAYDWAISDPFPYVGQILKIGSPYR